MTRLELWVQGSSAKALGWTLAHSLWEGAAIALALAMVLAVARSSRVRYWAACFAMVGLLAGFGATFYELMPRGNGLAAAPMVPAAASPSTGDGPMANIATPWDASDLLPWLAPLWIAGVLLFQLRYLASWIAAGRLQRVGVYRAPDSWIATLDTLRVRLRISRPVKLLESCVAEVPVVIGHLRPVILIPVGLLTGLPRGQIESILLHELAHIGRADYLVNLMQTVVEGLLFYHPAVWWISSVIRAERENCCDDIVVATSGNAREYATALAALAENRFATRAALAATGGSIVSRVRRLLAEPEGPRTALAPLLSAGILIITCAITLVAWQTPVENAAAIVAPTPPSVADSPRAKAVAQALDQLRDQMRKIEAKEGVRGSLLVAQNTARQLPRSASDPYQKWLNEEVVYIITQAERKAFLSLRTDDERNMFIKQFWARRDPTYPQTKSPEEYPVIPKGNPNNAFRTEHYRRIAYANDHFKAGVPGWKTDRGRIYIVYGPPDEIESHPSGGKYNRPPEQGGGETTTVPFEQWKYRYIEGIGTNVILEFVDAKRTGDYRLTTDPNAKEGRRVPEPVFASAGPGPKAFVVVEDDRNLRVTLPIWYDATEFSTTFTSLGGKRVWRGGAPLEDPCEGKLENSGCRADYTKTVTYPALDPGSYVLTASVTDNGTRTVKTYVVNFSVH